MIIEIKNFGPISYFKFDLTKDLHAIFGKNNIGKSYALSSVYLILKSFVQSRHVRTYGTDYYYYRSSYETRESSLLESVLQKVKISQLDTVSINSEVSKEITGILGKELMFDLNQSFQNSFSFDSIQNKYTQEPLEILISNELFELTIGLSDKNEKLYVKKLIFKSSICVKKINTNRSVRTTSTNVTIYYNYKTDSIQDLHGYIARLTMKINTSVIEHVSNVYFLPASRSGLYNALSTFGAIMAELSQSRNFVRAKIELPNISEPVSDYFLNLSSVKNSKVVNDYTTIAQEIESEILKGKLYFNAKTKKFSYQPENIAIDLDLSVTSSMIAEIAPIVAHLKFILTNRKRGQSLLFIEEPEAHLHPEIQIKLIEIFVRLVDKNVKVVMTSHSNYIFNKLSNLIISSKITPNRLQIGLMEMGKTGSKINEKAMAVDQYGIEDQNFADVADQLYDERIDLIDALNKKSV